MRTSLLQLLCIAAITRTVSNAGGPDCDTNSNSMQCRTSYTDSATQHTNSNTPRTDIRSTGTGVSHLTENTKVTTTAKSISTSQGTSITDSDSNITVIVAASVGTCAAVIFFILLIFIRRQHILRNCNFPNKKFDEKNSTRLSFNNNMYPDIEGISDDHKYAEIPLDNLDSIKNGDNVYQTIDPIQELETEIDNNYSHTSRKVWPLTNASYSHITGDFPNKRVVPDYTHIAKLEETQKRILKLKTNESDTSYDIIGKAKFEVSENQNVMEPTYDHTHNETNQTEISTSDVDNYSHLHVLNKNTQDNETMTNNQYNKHDEPVIDNPILLHKENGLCLKEGDAEPKFVIITEEKEPVAFVKLPEAIKFSLKEIDEENSVGHQYFVLENVDKTEDNESPVVKQPVANTFSLTENKEENAVDHQYFVLEKMDK